MNDTTISVREHGAVGDGQTDDTEAIRKAIAAAPPGGVVFFPPGHYLSDVIFPTNNITLQGNASWDYQRPGGTIISPAKEFQPRLIDLNGRIGTRISGLTLHGRNMGDEMHGIYSARGGNHEQGIIIENCRIERFSGSGVAMNESHVWTIRQSTIFGNGLDGIDTNNSFDGWIHDCQLVTNGRYGLSANNSTAISGNRIEHNHKAGLFVNRYYGQHLQITGNLFCSELGPAIEILEGNVRAIAITGNTFRNSAREVGDDDTRDCHVRFEGVQGLTFTGNALHILWNNHPNAGMILRGLKDSVVANNTLFKGAMKELIRDLGGHENCVIENNPGSLKEPGDIDS